MNYSSDFICIDKKPTPADQIKKNQRRTFGRLHTHTAAVGSKINILNKKINLFKRFIDRHIRRLNDGVSRSEKNDLFRLAWTAKEIGDPLIYLLTVTA